MREILLRWKWIDNRAWVHGGYVYDEKGGDIRIDAAEWCYDVDPETVGQYTGLTDKNGVKIFEGDIVDVETNGCRRRYEVKYGKVHVGFMLLNPKSGCTRFNDLLYGAPIEVIGNIHDNPELMEVQE